MARSKQSEVLAITLAMLCIGSTSAQQRHKALQASPNYALQCQGVTSASTSFKVEPPKVDTAKSTDFLRIVRSGQFLHVQVNVAQYNSMDQKSKALLQIPETYKIIAETGEGFVAIFVAGTTTLHTLTIDSSLAHGIWTESGFSFLDPQGKPISDTVSLACTKEMNKL